MPTPKTITAFAIEHDLRDFSFSGFPLDNGFEYAGIQLFETAALAQADIDEDVHHALARRDEEGLDVEDEDYRSDVEVKLEQGSVATVVIHADGQLFDSLGQDLTPHVAPLLNQTPQQVAENMAQYFFHAVGRIKAKTLESDSLQP